MTTRQPVHQPAEVESDRVEDPVLLSDFEPQVIAPDNAGGAKDLGIPDREHGSHVLRAVRSELVQDPDEFWCQF